MYCSPTKWWVGIARVSPTKRSKRSPAMACGYPTVRCSRAASTLSRKRVALHPMSRGFSNPADQADEKNRTGTVWFCFFPPGRTGEDGIGRFFRHWGGEALYNSHERDPVSSQAISCIGTPCLVEANVPIAALARHCGLEFNILRRFLVGRGLPGQGSADYEGRIVRPLPAANVRRVIRFPSPDFLELTRCLEWVRPISKTHKV